MAIMSGLKPCRREIQTAANTWSFWICYFILCYRWNWYVGILSNSVVLPVVVFPPINNYYTVNIGRIEGLVIGGLIACLC